MNFFKPTFLFLKHLVNSNITIIYEFCDIIIFRDHHALLRPHDHPIPKYRGHDTPNPPGLTPMEQHTMQNVAMGIKWWLR